MIDPQTQKNQQVFFFRKLTHRKLFGKTKSKKDHLRMLPSKNLAQPAKIYNWIATKEFPLQTALRQQI